jgi:hypothetical protein
MGYDRLPYDGEQGSFSAEQGKKTLWIREVIA